MRDMPLQDRSAQYIEHKQNENFPVDGEIPNLSIRSRRKPKSRSETHVVSLTREHGGTRKRYEDAARIIKAAIERSKKAWS
jgi:hypothetical protein